MQSQLLQRLLRDGWTACWLEVAVVGPGRRPLNRWSPHSLLSSTQWILVAYLIVPGPLHYNFNNGSAGTETEKRQERCTAGLQNVWLALTPCGFDVWRGDSNEVESRRSNDSNFHFHKLPLRGNLLQKSDYRQWSRPDKPRPATVLWCRPAKWQPRYFTAQV